MTFIQSVYNFKVGGEGGISFHFHGDKNLTIHSFQVGGGREAIHLTLKLGMCKKLSVN